MSLPPYYEATLLERGTGFHFATEPPKELAQPQALQSQDPITVLVAVLLQARMGNFGVFDHLLSLMRRDDSADTWNGCALLLAYAAPFSVIRKLLTVFQKEVYTSREGAVQEYVCKILAGCKGLWVVPEILDIYFRVADRKRFGSMPFYLSVLLEEERGIIADGPEAQKDTEPPTTGPLANLFDEDLIWYDDAGFRTTVEAKYAELSAKRPDGIGKTPAILEGELLSLEQVASKLRGRVVKKRDTEEVEIGRMTLEAFTGIDCTAFYKRHGGLQPLAAAAVVEDFLESGAAAKYEPGVRYFFGRRIPD